MNKTPKNLKHGYVFLTGIVLVLFSISFAIEMYFNGAFAFEENQEVQNDIEVINEKANSEELFIEIQNLDEDFTTKDSEITIVVFTNKGNQAWINQSEVKVDGQGTFEGKIDLIIGENEILIKVVSKNGDELQKSITVTREKVEEQSKEESTPTKIPVKTNTPPVQNTPTPKTDPVPTPEPVEPPLTGVKIQCSITNTQPSIDQSVSISCNVTDQNNNAVGGATGNITVNWKSGVQTYQLPSSNNSGLTSKSFDVPEGNTGSVNGVVKISRSGLTVTSNFSLLIQ